MCRVSPGLSAPKPWRVSITRNGAGAFSAAPPLGLVASVNQPLTSTTTSTLPRKLKRLTMPPEPTLTMTRLGTVWPPTKLRLDAVGWVAPAGQTVRKLGAVGLVTVTLRATADTPVAGTPPTPVTWRLRVTPGPNGP